jgi:hypothetical protein
VFDSNVNSEFLRGVHRVVGATGVSGYTYDITVLNKYSGATGTTSISSTAFTLTGCIKVADLVFSLTSGAGSTIPSSIMKFNSPLKSIAIGTTGATSSLDIVFTGWQVNDPSTIGISLINGAKLLYGPRVHFVDLGTALYLDGSILADDPATFV